MRLLSVMTTMLLLCTCVCAQTEEQWQATGELVKAEVNRIAVFVHRASDHKSRLLVGSGDAAALSPVGKYVMLPSAGWGYMPFATAYRVSEPFSFDIGTGAVCRILGAVVLGVGGKMPGTPRKIDHGVYMLALQPESRTTSKAVLVIDLRVDDDGRSEYKVLGKADLQPGPTNRGSSKPYVEAWFPDTNLYHDGISTSTTLFIEMAWKNEKHTLRLAEMDIWMM